LITRMLLLSLTGQQQTLINNYCPCTAASGISPPKGGLKVETVECPALVDLLQSRRMRAEQNRSIVSLHERCFNINGT